ncbi:YbaN family protein [Thalassovita taeanensis]|uniref:Inner membrane protein YbaN n=1 Tax=Thalassovita taeanensis TaxID=657014 RepID=A0A1H9JJY8_9RHOB|nr:YbaN family protein [Thalassovita taeanensis]SEQ87109.1 hypothetical protein SAMN04488092_11547 [Thalassovita taeanensis]
MRLIWGILGLVSVGFGLVGVFLPLLPTVPFMLLAAFCFARSSERMHAWLITHPVFGPSILDWQERGAIQPKAKKIATVSIVFVFAISLIMGLKPMILIIQAVTLASVLVFIWSRPSA